MRTWTLYQMLKWIKSWISAGDKKTFDSSSGLMPHQEGFCHGWTAAIFSNVHLRLLKDLGNTWVWMFKLLQENQKSFRRLYESILHIIEKEKAEMEKSVVEVFIVECKIVLQRKPGLSRMISSEGTPQIQLWWRTKHGQTAAFTR